MRVAVLFVLCLGALVGAALFGQDAKPGPQDSRQQDIDNAISTLGSEKFLESQAAHLELVEIGAPAVDAIVAAIRAEYKKVKEARDARPKQPEPPAQRRHILITILGEIRSNRAGVGEILVEALDDPAEFGTSVASAAASALAAIGDESAAPRLLDLLKKEKGPAESDRRLKFECIAALGIFRHKPASETIRKALEDKNTTAVGDQDTSAHLIAAAAASALGKIRAMDASDDLGKLLSDTTSDPFTGRPLNWHVAKALQRIWWEEMKPGNNVNALDVKLQSLEGEEADYKKIIDAWQEWWKKRENEKKVDITRKKVMEVAAAVEEFKKDNEAVPMVLEDLVIKPATAKKWRDGGYYKYTGDVHHAFDDAWGNKLRYRTPGTGAEFDVFSYGADNRVWGGGVDADIYNHDKYKQELIDKTKKKMDEILKALEAFKIDNGEYPREFKDLWVKPDYWKKWEKAYVEALPRDGWENLFVYRKPSKVPKEKDPPPFDLIAPGEDRMIDTADDIWNHDKRP